MKKVIFFLLMMSMSIFVITAEELYENPFPPAEELKVDPQPGDQDLIIEEDGIPWLVLRNILLVKETYEEARIYIEKRLEDLKKDDKLITSLTEENYQLRNEKIFFTGLSVGLGIATLSISLILIFD